MDNDLLNDLEDLGGEEELNVEHLDQTTTGTLDMNTNKIAGSGSTSYNHNKDLDALDDRDENMDEDMDNDDEEDAEEDMEIDRYLLESIKQA
jgi:hypothetical protein